MLVFKRAEFVWYLVPAVFLSVQSLLSYSVVLELGAGLGQVRKHSRTRSERVLRESSRPKRALKGEPIARAARLPKLT